MEKNVVEIKKATPAPETDFCLTPTAQEILHVLEYCQSRGEMGAIVGAPGVGKTSSFNYYLAKNSRVFMITMSPAYEKPARMISAIAGALGHWFASSGDAYEKIKGSYSKGDLFIIDEAQHLDESSLEMLRCLYDHCGFGLVVGGNPMVITRFKGAREARFEHFLSRIGIHLNIEESLPEDFDAFFDHHKVVGARARAILLRMGKRRGGLRVITKIINLAREKGGGARAIELQQIEYAITFLGLGDAR